MMTYVKNDLENYYHFSNIIYVTLKRLSAPSLRPLSNNA